MEEKELQKQLENIKTEIDGKINQALVEEFITKESLSYKHNDVIYKVVRPTFEDKQEVFKAIAKKKMQMLDSGEFYPADVLKAKWFKNGIDINEIEKSIKELAEEKQKVQEQLGAILTDENRLDNYKSYEDKIKELNEKIQLKRMKILSYLDCSIETQIEVFAYNYLAFVLTKKLQGEEFVRAWGSFEEFQKQDGKLINTLSLYTSVLCQDEFNI